MKRLLVVLVLYLPLLRAYGQTLVVLGKSKLEVQEYFATHQPNFKPGIELPDALTFKPIEKTEPHYLYYDFDSAGLCSGVALYFYAHNFNSFIDVVQKHYNFVSENIWKSKNEPVGFAIIWSKDETYFTVTYMKMDF